MNDNNYENEIDQADICFMRIYDAIIYRHDTLHHIRELVTVLSTNNRTNFATMQHRENGQTLLHVACWQRTMSNDIIEYLIGLGPEALIITDESGETPLHRACIWADESPERVRLVLQHCPEAARVVESHGATPLHMACICTNNGRLSLQNIELLARQYPLACLLTCSHYDRRRVECQKSPLGLVRLNGDEEIIGFLTKFTADTEAALTLAVVSNEYSGLISKQDKAEMLRSEPNQSIDTLPSRRRLHTVELIEFIDGMARIENSRRKRRRGATDEGNADIVRLCSLVNDHLSCLWLLLRRDPESLQRHRPVGIRVASAKTTTATTTGSGPVELL